jgi:hypothetical protein
MLVVSQEDKWKANWEKVLQQMKVDDYARAVWVSVNEIFEVSKIVIFCTTIKEWQKLGNFLS